MIDKRRPNPRDAIGDIFDGAVVLVGGFGRGGVPAHLLDALREHGARDLTIVSNGTGRQGTPLANLIDTGCVTRVIASSAKGHAPEPTPFERLWREGHIELELVPQGTFVERIRAGGAGLGPFYGPVGVGTPLSDGKELREFDGRTYSLEHPIKADFALLRATLADRWGNLHYRFAERNFNSAMATAANVAIAEVSEIVELGEIDPMLVGTPSIYVDRVVEVGT